MNDSDSIASDASRTDLARRLRAYLSSTDEPRLRLKASWLAEQLGAGERELLGALAVAVREGIATVNWEMVCPVCNDIVESLGSLELAKSSFTCAACGSVQETSLDLNIQVTFSAPSSEQADELHTAPDEDYPSTRGLDLLMVPEFWEFFASEAPEVDHALRVGRVAILFTDLRGSTALYAERGDSAAYQIVRRHFEIVGLAVRRNRGAIVKTVGDAVMATFSSGADAVRAALESQSELKENSEELGTELVLKAGVHVASCLAVRMNGRLDFFGTGVNLVARLVGRSGGRDVVITEEARADLGNSSRAGAIAARVDENFDATLRGLPGSFRLYRAVEA